MNKKLNEYKKKFNKIIKTFEILAILIFLLGVLISIVQYTMNKSKSLEENQKGVNGDSNYIIDLEDNTVIFQNSLKVNLNIKDFEEDSIYKIIIKLNDEIIIEQENIDAQDTFGIQITNEGAKDINITIYKNNEEKANFNKKVFYVKPYTTQFLDELSNRGVGVHYRSHDEYEDYNKSLEMISALGAKNIRTDIWYWRIAKSKGKYDFSYVDEWVKEATNRNINILLILKGFSNNGFSSIIDTNTEREEYANFVKATIKRYPQITNYEVLNEPNFSYIGENSVKEYSKLVKITNDIIKENTNNKINIISGVLANLSTTTSSGMSATEFFDILTNNDGYKYSTTYSYHPYDRENGAKQCSNLKGSLEKYNKLYNRYGGFIKNYSTEYGFYMDNAAKTEEVQAKKLVQQTVLMDYYGVDMSLIYNFWNTGTDITYSENNYGLVNNDYTPKLSFYAIKNLYENTNGAQYIGKINFGDLEMYVYDKDGKPVIIAWSSTTEKDITINYKQVASGSNFLAKDIYGNEINLDKNGDLKITTLPVYFYNVDYNCFYKAISNTAERKYNEFTEQFSEQILKVQGLQLSIQNIHKTIQDIYNNSTVNETTAINLMQQHYNLGNTIIKAYKSGNLTIEYVTLSSMLDMLNDIGNSFEDLVTVSAKTRNANLSETLNSITSAENIINDNDIEMIYPTKILQFSQDFYDTANHINNLEEENDIKTGLIVSKNLHSKLLANWAQEFANLYIDEYISNNPVEIEYSTTEITNQPVTATLKTNANMTVTNNSNSKTYTFDKNGSFTFEYTIKGRVFKKTATVTNIDKTPPKITGVENDKLYTEKVTPQIQDENLQKVTLYKNSNLVQDYKTNSTISEDGHYKLIATDKVTNQTTIEFDISRNPATIQYSTTNLTNQDVTATLVSNYQIEVTNNSNKTIHTFTKNGEFTFEFRIKGTSFKLKASVNNIDKTPPVITGVEKNKQYIDKAKPVITDENLSDVKLYLNSYQVKDYVTGSEISGEGFYKIVATDKAGNETTVEFTIMESASEEYKFKDNYILNIKNNTKKSEFDKKLNIAIKYDIIRNGNKLNENDKIITGDVLRTEAGEEYTLVINGDINKDGDVNIKDIIKLRKYLLERNNLDEVSLRAADCNLDGKSISIKDLIRMRLIVLERDVT